MMKTVAVLGASDKRERYSYMAVEKLIAKGYETFPVNPRLETVLGIKCLSDPDSLPRGIDTVTVYLNPGIFIPMLKSIADLSPRRVIFNPGTESEEASAYLSERGVETIKACTLVLLSTNQF